jgi:cell division protease FtsH
MIFRHVYSLFLACPFQKENLVTLYGQRPIKKTFWTDTNMTTTSSYIDSLEQKTFGKKFRFRERKKSSVRSRNIILTPETARIMIPLQQTPSLLGLWPERNQTFGSSYSNGGNTGAFSESGAFRLEDTRDDFNFTRIGGYYDLKEELRQIMDFIWHPSNYTQYGVRIPRGILLEGPTGNGKTLIAKCLAGEARMNFISTSGSEFNEKYVGVGSARIRELFHFAQKQKPCLIFIDEIDALGRKRTNDGEAAGAERDQTLNQLLCMMDGFSSTSEVVVIGATNRIDILDRALLRPGRIDKIIHVPNPDADTRREIIDIHLEKKPVNVSVDYLVKLTHGFNGAQIENLLNEATLYGIRHDHLPITSQILDMMKEKILIGVTTSRQRKNMSLEAQRRIALHEIGHLVMALVAEDHEKPWKISIDSTNSQNSFGYTIFESDDVDEGLYTRQHFIDKIKVLLGGRVAEEVFYGHSISSGALSDLEKAFSMAKKMVMEYGMGNDVIYPYFSETYKKRIDEQIHSIILRAYKDTLSFLEKHKEYLEKFSQELLERRTMSAEEILQFHANFFD